jgi:hypothetical protein
VSQFKIGVEKSQQQYRDFHQELIQAQQQARDLKIVIATSEGNHRETLEVVSEKSKENAFLKNELSKLKHSNESMMDQVKNYENLSILIVRRKFLNAVLFKISQYDEKYKFVKNEFRKLQEDSHKSLHQVRVFFR